MKEHFFIEAMAITSGSERVSMKDGIKKVYKSISISNGDDLVLPGLRCDDGLDVSKIVGFHRYRFGVRIGTYNGNIFLVCVSATELK